MGKEREELGASTLDVGEGDEKGSRLPCLVPNSFDTHCETLLRLEEKRRERQAAVHPTGSERKRMGEGGSLAYRYLLQAVFIRIVVEGVRRARNKVQTRDQPKCGRSFSRKGSRKKGDVDPRKK